MKVVLSCRPLRRPSNLISHAYLFNPLPETERGGGGRRGSPATPILLSVKYFTQKLEHPTIASNSQIIVALLPLFGKAIGQSTIDLGRFRVPTGVCFARKKRLNGEKRNSPCELCPILPFKGGYD